MGVRAPYNPPILSTYRKNLYQHPILHSLKFDGFVLTHQLPTWCKIMLKFAYSNCSKSNSNHNAIDIDIDIDIGNRSTKANKNEKKNKK